MDDKLSEPFLTARREGKDPAHVLSKAEDDLGPEAVIYIGPRGVEYLAASMGIDIGVSTVDDNSAPQ